MAMSIVSITPSFVAEIGDVNLSKPLSAEDVATIKNAFWHYAVLIFPGQELNEQQQLAFAQYFGPLETNLATYNADATFRITPDLIDISNLTPRNEIWTENSHASVSPRQPFVAHR